MQETTNKVLLYPYLKKTGTKVDMDDVKQEEVEAIIDHYLYQFVQQLKNHGFDLNGSFATDFHFASEFTKSAVFKTVGIHHKLQDAVDEMLEEAHFENIDDED
jgi:hypothetical protein